MMQVAGGIAWRRDLNADDFDRVSDRALFRIVRREFRSVASEIAANAAIGPGDHAVTKTASNRSK